VLLGVVAALAGLSWLAVIHLGAPADARLVDLAVYRDAARSVVDGRRVYAYATPPPQDLLFTYPPFAALASLPLLALPVRALQVVWTLGELATTTALCAYGFRALLQRVRRGPAGVWSPVVLGLLTAVVTQLLPFRDEIKFGQVDEILALLCVVDCLRRGGRRRDGPVGRVPQGVLVGVAAAVKLTPLVFVPYLVLTARRRAAAVAVATFVALQLVTAAVIPHDSDDYWTDALFHSGRLRDNASPSNQSLRGIELRLPGPHGWGVALLVVALVVVAVAGYVGSRRASRAGHELTGVALVGLLAVLLSPVAWIHHLVWLPLVVGVVLGDARSRRRVIAAVGVLAYFTVKLPWIGRHMHDTAWPAWLGGLLQDAYGIAAAVIIVGYAWITRMGESSEPDAGHTDGESVPAGPGRDLEELPR
jgi:alpha-1,2-mannosyltransferase